MIAPGITRGALGPRRFRVTVSGSTECDTHGWPFMLRIDYKAHVPGGHVALVRRIAFVELRALRVGQWQHVCSVIDHDLHERITDQIIADEIPEGSLCRG